MKRRFTDLMIDRLRAPAEGRRLEIGDEVTPGLVVRVTPQGRKSWSVLYRVEGEGGLSGRTGNPLKGRQQRLTLGPYPAVDLATARRRARDALAAASECRDPLAELRAEAKARVTNSVEKIAELFIERHAKVSTKKWKNTEQLFKDHVLPEWGNRPIRAITRSDVHALLDKISGEKKRPRLAAEVRKHAGRLFSWALDREYVVANPFHRLDRPDDESYVPRERHLSDEELRWAWLAADMLGYPYGPALKVIALTGARAGNVCLARWPWVDTQARLLTVPREEFKSRRPHEVPLADHAWDIVKELPRFNKCDWLFRATRGDGAAHNWSDIKERVDDWITEERGGEALPAWTIHDLRRTVKTGLARLKVPSEIRDRVLGHAKKGMDQVYDQHAYLDEKRAALQKWADHVRSVVK